LVLQNDPGLIAVAIAIIICIPVVVWAVRKSKQDNAERCAELKEYFLLEPRNIILTSLQSMKEGVDARGYAKRIREEAGRITDDNLFEPVVELEQLASDVGYLIYCRSALPSIIRNLENGTYRLEDFTFGETVVTLAKLKEAQAWLEDNYAYEPKKKIDVNGSGIEESE
jgi:hypothetical protein